MNRRQPPGIWATNHLANPIMRQLLRGPAGHRLSRRLALIRYPGHRTGRIYELPVQYARSGNRIWILPGSPEHKTWWRNLRGGAEVHLVLARRNIRGHAVVLDRSRPPELAEGLTAYLHAVPQARRAIGLPKHASPSPGDAELRQISDSAVLVRVDLDD
jgi:hypothetical protein